MTAPFISPSELPEIAVAHFVFKRQVQLDRAIAAAHRTEFEKTGCLASLRTAWRHDELAEEAELIEKELAAVLALAAEDRP